MSSRRLWFAREAQFTADPKIQELGDSHGPAGPLVIEEVFALAKLEDLSGYVSGSYAVLARRAFTSPARAKAIVEDAIRLGILTPDQGTNGRTWSVSIPRWSRWQVKDPTAADRQAKRRNVTGLSR